VLFSRLSKGDPGCPLCNNDVESVSHLFFKCNATKMFWFGTCWGVRADLFVVKLVVDLPISITDPLLLKQNMKLASVQVALTLEANGDFETSMCTLLK
jgi:hypothetical protein